MTESGDRLPGERQRSATDGRLDVVLEHSPCSIFVIDGDGMIQFVNPAGEELLGRSREALVGLPFGQPVDEGEITLIRRDGVMISGKCHRAPIAWDGSTEMTLVFVTDLTETRRAEKAIRAANEGMAHRISALETFSFSLAHDIRAPLRAIQGFLRVAREDADSLKPEELRVLLDRGLARCEYLRDLVEGMLVFAQSALRPLNWARVDLHELLRSIVDDLSQSDSAVKKRIEISALPAVHGDPIMIRQVFANLISNALKYSKPGDGPNVKVDALVGDDSTCIRVTDNGIGFSQEDADRLFEMFVRLDPERCEGAGVGLAAVKATVERHGGSIRAEGTLGEGATFYLTFPHGAPESLARLDVQAS